jgi:hypothetical protein
MTKYISLVSPSTNNELFLKKRKWILNFARDDQNSGFVELRKILYSLDIKIHTNDFFNRKKIVPDLELHFVRSYPVKKDMLSYLFLPEAKEIIPKNDIAKLKKKYHKIFCQYDKYIDNKKIFKLNYPYHLNFNRNQKSFERRSFSCIISSNKNLVKNVKNNLYPLRFNLIKWYEKYNLDFLNVYGSGWNLPPKKSGVFGRFLNFLNKLGFCKFYYSIPENYVGTIKSKNKILSNYKFSFCFENCEIDGYFSDIIFDSMNAGAIPVYMGSKSVNKYIPKNCFINARKFENFDALHEYLLSINKNDYSKYIYNIKKFYNSKKSGVFKKKLFISTLLNHFSIDLN